MPIIKSAKKRVKIAAKAKARNDKTRAQVRDSFKAFKRALEQGKAELISKTQLEATSAIDMAAKYNVLHKNKAARKKSQLAKLAKAKGVKPVKSSKPAPKTAKAKSASKKPAKKTKS